MNNKNVDEKKENKQEKDIINEEQNTEVKKITHNRVFFVIFLLLFASFLGVTFYFPEEINSVLNKAKLTVAPEKEEQISSPKPNVNEETVMTVALLQRKIDELEGVMLSPEIFQQMVNKINFLERELVVFVKEQSKFNAEIVSSLNQKIAYLQEQLDESSLRNNKNVAPLLVSIIKLKEAVLAGKPFEKEINIVSSLAGNNKEISDEVDTLKSYQNGIQTEDELKKELPKLMTDALTPKAPENASFLDKTWAKIKALVVVRRVDDNGEKYTTDYILSKAEKFANEDKLLMAKETLESLPEEALVYFKSWREKVSELEKAKASLENMIQTVLNSLSEEQKEDKIEEKQKTDTELKKEDKNAKDELQTLPNTKENAK